MSQKVLVVDDEADFVELITFTLREAGYHVLTANNGLDAVWIARRAQPDLIILDLMMEGIDGLSACEILRRQLSTRRLPILLITAALGEMTRLNSLAAGATDFMRKPFSPRDLVSRVGELMARWKIQERLLMDTELSPLPLE